MAKWKDSKYFITISGRGGDSLEIEIKLNRKEAKLIRKIEKRFDDITDFDLPHLTFGKISRNCQYVLPHEKIKLNNGKKKPYHLCLEKPEAYCKFRKILKEGKSSFPICNRKFYIERG